MRGAEKQIAIIVRSDVFAFLMEACWQETREGVPLALPIFMLRAGLLRAAKVTQGKPHLVELRWKEWTSHGHRVSLMACSPMYKALQEAADSRCLSVALFCTEAAIEDAEFRLGKRFRRSVLPTGRWRGEKKMEAA